MRSGYTWLAQDVALREGQGTRHLILEVVRRFYGPGRDLAFTPPALQHAYDSDEASCQSRVRSRVEAEAAT